MNLKKIILLSGAVFLLLFLAAIPGVRAQSSTIVNVDFPCPDGTFGLGDCQPSTNIPNYLNNLYKFAVGMAGLLALGMIVAGGVYYTISAGSSDKQKEAKDMITSALWGVALLLGSYLILNTVNPEITKLNLGFTDIEGRNVVRLNPTNSGEIEVGSGGCPDFKTIRMYPASAEGKLGNMCQFRKNILKNAIALDNEDGYYNDDTGGFGRDTDIDANAYIWTYPYYKRDSGPTSARCLVYAYKELNNPSSTVMITLDDSLNMCAPQQFTNLICEKWTFSASESQTEGGPKTIITRDVSVSDSFKYEDPARPPSATKLPWDDICKVENTRYHYFDHCSDRSWDCTQLKP
jgi:hypothetical protein